ncbi:MAG TPA: hypothetical protein VLD84_06215, partial [Nitrososphaeraceae archaeon]|nr:hypothetical protein [Nitrososphaeraceae archaeon]
SQFWSRKRRDSVKHCKGIKYYPSSRAIMPDIKKINSFVDTQYSYVLIDILGPNGFWDKRDNPDTFDTTCDLSILFQAFGLLSPRSNLSGFRII